MTKVLAFILILSIFIAGCSSAEQEIPLEEPSIVEEQPVMESPVTEIIETSSNVPSPLETSTKTLQPSDIEYLGAFRLPEASGGSNWEFSGYAATFYPEGDQASNDNYPGSLFAIGHDHHQMVSEVSIPTPVISKNVEDLNTAETLQPFADIRGNLYGEQEIPRAGIVYHKDKLYFSWGQHFEFEITPTHGRSSLDLSDPQTEGLWRIENYPNYILNDYMFEIPASWYQKNTPGKTLATGRFRDGLWSGRGPALLAINDEPGNNVLEATPLLLYGTVEPGNPEIIQSEDIAMDGFSEPDEWSGAEWLTAEDKAAVIFVGTKAVGKSWYGFANGIVYPTSGDEDEVYPDVPDWPYDERGWWSEDIQAQMIFYDPADLAAVAQGQMETWEPQPYAVFNLDPYLINPGFNYEAGKRYLVGAVAYDRENEYLYVFERLADGDGKSVVHVFKVG
ncbi:hypothetical protein COV20_01645 [Candidatus Woesearchaeota archaeon CG10_big_fil_rev_8_21_14_0_10_45_16]|nr:MAG: hypothetical protein COV20_01645 [Candidatus Woesearchaeota archaeon CG10_big_fil_rev_8_21_14_0_10_45_16]